jgi:hypothetical protein
MPAKTNAQLKLPQRNLFTEGKKKRTGTQMVRQKMKK